MSRRFLGVGVAVLVGMGCMAVVWFLLRQHAVERAGAWAGILGLMGLPVAVWGMWLATKPIVRSSAPTPTVRLQQNKASDGGTAAAVEGSASLCKRSRIPRPSKIGDPFPTQSPPA